MAANADLTVNRHSSTTSSALALADVLADDRARVGGNSRSLSMELLQRVTRDDYDRWLATALAAGGCVRPVRLRGTIRDVDTVTGEILDRLDTEDLPDEARSAAEEPSPGADRAAESASARTGAASPADRSTRTLIPAWAGRCVRTVTTTQRLSCGTLTRLSCGGAPPSPSAVGWTSSQRLTARG
jgi:hypothetical protein